MASITVITVKKGKTLYIHLWNRNGSSSPSVKQLSYTCFKSIVVDAFGGRPGMSMTSGLVQIIDLFEGDFTVKKLEDWDVLMSSESWKEQDLRRFLDCKELAGNQWFTGKIDEDKIHAAFRTASDLISGSDIQTDFECLGLADNGFSVIWAHPDAERKEIALKNLDSIEGVKFGAETDLPEYLAWEAEVEGKADAAARSLLDQVRQK